MISIKEKPRHLYASLVAFRRDYPCENFSLETLELSAELDDRVVDFRISLILCDRTTCCESVLVGSVPNSPDEHTAYIVDKRDDLIKQIGEQLNVKRRTTKSDNSIIEWVALRAKEYANNRIL